ncbi:hypothetical protein [Serratia grimesii]|uniref:hypothetical protein n=1 Tax=Serratia grimesii TaxID=82995 RepID=UPI00217B77F4|nr:hypothetical protein [Serratia grimesii]CAI1094609.1 Uncharacterised protein [Serratia grimesii]
MTQTLTTKQLIAIASGEFDACSVLDASVSMARELLANREEQPVAIVESSDYVTAAQITGDEPRRKAVKEMFEGALVIGQHLYAAQPAPAVPVEIRNVYRAEGLAEVLKDAREYAPLTAEQWGTLVKNWHQTFVGLSGDANACRAAMLAQPVSRGDNWKLVPVEPTAEMINAALASGAISIRTAYSAMLAAAPEGGNG